MCNDIVNNIIECIGRTKKVGQKLAFLGKSDFGKFPCLQNDFLHLFEKLSLTNDIDNYDNDFCKFILQRSTQVKNVGFTN